MPSLDLPLVGFLRLRDIIGDRKAGIPPIIPVSRSVWYERVRAGRYPAPVKLGPRTSAYRVEDIPALLVELSQ